MRVLVCGGRTFCDKDLLYKVLDKAHKELDFDILIEGNALGADRLAGYWAAQNLISHYKYYAEWDKYGRSDGPIRN